MENPATGNRYKEKRRKAKKFYRTIGCVWCPALDDYVIFNDIGFRHLIQKGKRFRAQKDQERRFFLLRLVKDILSDPHSEITQREKKPSCLTHRPQEMQPNSCLTFWAITAKRSQNLITVVIRQVNSGDKHFFSVYHQKTAR